MLGLIAIDKAPSEVVRPSQQIKPTKRVLVFNEFGSYVPGVALALSEIRSSLSEQSEYKVDLFDESLDTSLFPEKTSQEEIWASYVHKYRDKKPDIIVALGPTPIKFLAESRATFFPDVPIVFCGSTPGQAEHPKLDSHFTGAWMVVDPAKTLEAALRLQPDTKRVVVVGGIAPFDRGVESFVKAALRSYESSAELLNISSIWICRLCSVASNICPSIPSCSTRLSRSTPRDRVLSTPRNLFRWSRKPLTPLSTAWPTLS